MGEFGLGVRLWVMGRMLIGRVVEGRKCIVTDRGFYFRLRAGMCLLILEGWWH